MAQLTSNQTLTGAAYVKIADSGQKILLEARSGEVEFFYKSTIPGNSDAGHWLREGRYHGETLGENLWARSKDGVGAASIVISKG